jgi:hypothetical protein
MNRSDFLKRLGLVAVAIPLAPKIATEAAELLDMGKEEGFEYPDFDEVHRRWGNRSAQEFIEVFQETGNLMYSHYEQPWIGDANPWPLQEFDAIITPDNKTYVVTEVRYGSAVLTPENKRDKIIIAHKGDEMIRFSNFKSNL